MAEWLDDGSATISGAGPVVTCNAEPKGDNVFHALWKGDGSVSSGVHFWEVEDKGGLGAVGMTTQEKFGKGYSCRSFNFNAINLSDGGALLVGQYGPGHFNAGDKVGLLCEMTDAALTITFYLNGKCLGPAFQVAKPYPTELYPVITFKHGGSAAIQKVNAVPEVRTRVAEAKPFPEGDWQLQGATGEFRSAGRCHIGKEAEGAYRVSLKVINNVNVRITNSGGAWSASPGMSTMMAGPPELMQLEQETSHKLQTMNSLQQRDGHLVISSPNGELVFAPAAPHLEIPYTGNPLAR